MTIQAQHPLRPADSSSAGSSQPATPRLTLRRSTAPRSGSPHVTRPSSTDSSCLTTAPVIVRCRPPALPPAAICRSRTGTSSACSRSTARSPTSAAGLIADVRIEDSQVSRRHAIIARRGGAVRVLDDRSSNGTYVNGRAVNGAYLNDGDVVRFGRAAFRYVLVEGQRAKTPLRRMPIAGPSRRRRGARVPAPAGPRRCCSLTPAPALQPDPAAGASGLPRAAAPADGDPSRAPPPPAGRPATAAPSRP